MVDFAELITNVIASGASDLHLSVGAPPVMRLNGELVRIGDKPLDLAGHPRAGATGS